MPVHSPGLKAVLSYYTSTVKISAEGDVHLSNEALSGLGTTIEFLKTSLFGAILQLVRPAHAPSPPSQQTQPSTSHTTNDTTTVTYNPETKTFEQQPPTGVPTEDDPHMPPKPARRKPEQDPHTLPIDAQKPEQERFRLTDFVPDVGYFIAGAVAGITSRTATAPLDRLKVYLIAQVGPSTEAVQAAKNAAPLQATKHGARTIINACKDLWAAGGMKSLFAGESPPCRATVVSGHSRVCS